MVLGAINSSVARVAGWKVLARLVALLPVDDHLEAVGVAESLHVGLHEVVVNRALVGENLLGVDLARRDQLAHAAQIALGPLAGGDERKLLVERLRVIDVHALVVAAEDHLAVKFQKTQPGFDGAHDAGAVDEHVELVTGQCRRNILLFGVDLDVRRRDVEPTLVRLRDRHEARAEALRQLRGEDAHRALAEHEHLAVLHLGEIDDMQRRRAEWQRDAALRIGDAVEHRQALDRADDELRRAAESRVHILVAERTGHVGELADQPLIDVVARFDDPPHGFIAGNEGKDEWRRRDQAVEGHLLGAGADRRPPGFNQNIGRGDRLERHLAQLDLLNAAEDDGFGFLRFHAVSLFQTAPLALSFFSLCFSSSRRMTNCAALMR